MKKIFSAIAIILLANFSFAQTYQFGIDTVSEVGVWSDAQADNNYLIQTTDMLINSTPDTVASSWTREIVALPTAWTTSVCDPVNCWGEATSSSNFNFLPSLHGSVVVDFKPHFTGGVGVVKLTFRRQSNSSDSAIATFIGTLEAGSGIVKTEQLKSVKVYPVPADKKLFVVTPDAVSSSKVEVYNLLGQLQQTTTTTKVNSNLVELDIASLKEGAYFVKVQTTDGKAVVLKFTKS